MTSAWLPISLQKIVIQGLCETFTLMTPLKPAPVVGESM